MSVKFLSVLSVLKMLPTKSLPQWKEVVKFVKFDLGLLPTLLEVPIVKLGIQEPLQCHQNVGELCKINEHLRQVSCWAIQQYEQDPRNITSMYHSVCFDTVRRVYFDVTPKEEKEITIFGASSKRVIVLEPRFDYNKVAELGEIPTPVNNSFCRGKRSNFWKFV